MFIRLIILALFSFFIAQIPNKFLSLDYFNIVEIELIENSKMLQTELTSLRKKLYNKNNFDIDYKELERTLKNDIRVKDVNIEEIGLGKLKIEVIDKDFSYYANIKKDIYLVDERGDVFGYIGEKKKESVPLIVAKTQDGIKEMSAILNLIQDRPLFKHISQIYKKNEDEYRIVLRDGVELIVNNEVDRGKYKILEILYSEMKKNKKIEYIDLRFDDYIIKYLGDE
ncbi:MAG: cell division protein FtsQ/DivIB [Fusobacterium sp.]|uniref:cell division protein FtsQ/DivIB n=1 Tax=Fusobacterium sp. TaxID=68766 RepID=UPI0026DCB898|nr:cell division protein FtsQ/DivIB [Fusobacterium sp.]MDO4690988.1 cell division protein FtsQ/DivIB [Fusobacterium sp.]